MSHFTSKPVEQRAESKAQPVSDISTGPAPDPCWILLIDQRPLLRTSMAKFIEASIHGSRVLPVSCPSHLTQKPVSDDLEQVGLVVYSVSAPQGSPDGLEQAIRVLRESLPEAPLILLADSDDRAQVLEALRLGVRGYIPTTLKSRVVVAAIKLVQAGGTFVPVSAVSEMNGEATPVNDGKLRKRAIWPDLTPRQLEVLELLRLGKSNKIIAYELKMRESTVKVHMRHIMKKLKATNRTQAACIANRLLSEARATPQVEPLLQLLPTADEQPAT